MTLIYEEGTSFGWSESFGPTKSTKDNHRYIVGPYGNGLTRFIQKDQFLGTDKTVATLKYAKGTMKLYQTFNRELKAAVEK